VLYISSWCFSYGQERRIRRKVPNLQEGKGGIGAKKRGAAGNEGESQTTRSH